MLFRYVFSLVRELRTIEVELVGEDWFHRPYCDFVCGARVEGTPLNETANETAEIKDAHHMTPRNRDEGGGWKTPGIVLSVRVGYDLIITRTNDHN